MRKTTLKHTSIAVSIGVIGMLVILALLRTFVFHPAQWYARMGEELFVEKGCSRCHLVDSAETLVGPGLKGLFKREELPVSGWKVNEENIRRQLAAPFMGMPSFSDRLTMEEQDFLIAFLKTL